MLSELLPQRPAGTEAGGGDDRPSKVPRVMRVADEEVMVNDEELCEPAEWQDPAVYAQWIEPVSKQAHSAETSNDLKEESEVAHSQGTLSKHLIERRF